MNCKKKINTNIHYCFDFLGKCALSDRGKCAIFEANVSKIKGQMCNFAGKCAIFDQGKCAKGK